MSDNHEHDLEEVENSELYEDDDRVAYAVTKACREEGCNFRVNSIEVTGPHPDTAEEMRDLAWNMYCDFYENPRSIGYFTLSALVSGDFMADLWAADYLAAAVDAATTDAEDDRDKRDRETLISRLPTIE